MVNKKAWCKVSIAPLRKESSDTSEIVSQLLFGELVTIEEINEPWAKITTFNDSYDGYVDFKHLLILSDKEVKRWLDGITTLAEREVRINSPWGVQHICRGSNVPYGVKTFNVGRNHFEFIDYPEPKTSSIIELTESYLNTPYLWGGKSPFGIDCSGLTQVIYRIVGVNLPRDAKDQVTCGSEIEYDDIQEGDLAFFDKNGKVTHVGILDGKGNIFHAAGLVRKDLISREGILRNEDHELTHHLYGIRRV